MAAILTSDMLDSDNVILDSDTLLSSLKFTQKHSHSNLTLTQTNSIWLTWWWQPSCILPSWIQPFCKKKLHLLILTQLEDCSHLELCYIRFCHFVQKKLQSFILTQPDDGSHLEFCHLELDHLGFSHLSFSFQSHSQLPRMIPTICTKKLHSFNLTQLHDGSHLEFCHLGFRHCHFGFRHLVNFSWIHSKTLSLHSDSDSN